MTMWLLEFSRDGWEGLTPRVAFATEAAGLKAYNKLRRKRAKRHGIRIQRYTSPDGVHYSSWGQYRMRLREVVMLG